MRYATLIGFTAKEDIRHVATGHAQEVRRVFKAATVAEGHLKGLVRVEYFDTDGSRQKRGLDQPAAKPARSSG